MQRDDELNKLKRNHNAVVSAATQTHDDDDGDDSADGSDGCYDHSTEGDNQSDKAGNTLGTTANNRGRFKKAARSVKIYSQKMDYSHVRSKVDTNLTLSQAPSRSSISRTSGDIYSLYGRRGSRNMTLADEEVNKLKKLLAEV